MCIRDSLYKAAKVDGCSDWRYLWKVMIPMNKNAIATIGILAFISQWNSFVWPLMVTKSDAHRAVSYTHLDVYKRQRFQSTAMVVPGSVFAISSTPFLALT